MYRRMAHISFLAFGQRPLEARPADLSYLNKGIVG